MHHSLVNRSKRRICLSAACALLLSGAFATAVGAVEPALGRVHGMRVDASLARAPAEQPRAEYEYHVLAGELAVQRGNPVVAAREYGAALEYSKDTALAKRATRIALYAGKPKLAYRAATIWADGAPDSLDAQRGTVRLALALGNAEGLGRYAPALVAAAASEADGYALLAKTLIGEPAHGDLAIEAAQRLAKENDKSAAAQYALGVVALRYKHKELAARAAERALRLQPDWDDAVLLQAAVWIRSDNTDKAKTLIGGLPGNKAKRAEYHLALARLLIQADQNQAALDAFQQALDLQPTNTDARYGLGVLALGLNELDRAEKAFKKLFAAHERTDDAAYYLGVIHDQRDEYAAAQRWYQKVENASHAFEAQLRAVRMIYDQGDLAGARDRLDELRGIYPDRITRLYAAEGQLLFEADQPRAALELFNKGLRLDGDSNALRYGRSMVYEQLDRIDAAEADLRALLSREPEDAKALNALGYLLANHTSRYAEARDYIQRALKIKPDNPAILDSMGWVLYRLGHLDKARTYLERAYDDYRDPEVAAHLGEVLWKQGHKDAARRIWQGAASEHSDHQVLKSTMARFQQ